MKSKTSKYAALAIIVIGILFIYFIPQIFKKGDCKSCCTPINAPITQKVKVALNSLITEKAKFSDKEFQDAFNEAEVLILIGNIKLSENNKMHGDIIGIINKHNISLRYKVGDNEFVDNIVNAPEGFVSPEGAVVFLRTGSNYIKNGNKWYFNSGVLSNGYAFEYMKKVFEQHNEK